MSKTRSEAVLALNGEILRVSASDASLTLADFLRVRRRLTGTKVVCAEGDCGACTVLRAFPVAAPARDPKPVFLPVNSCVITVAQMDGSSLVTVDALKTSSLTPVQTAMMKCHGSQCGFCTPGFVMALTGLVEKKRARHEGTISPSDAKNALTGNLCRCTGYAPIIEAASQIEVSACAPLEERFWTPKIRSTLAKATQTPLFISQGEFEFFAPKTLKAAVAFRRRHPSTRVIGAATDLGVVRNKGRLTFTSCLSLHLIPDLYRIRTLPSTGRSSRTRTPTRLWVGARVSLSDLRSHIHTSIPEFSRFLDLFASPQIKNFATLVGNIATASPIADTPPFLMISHAWIHTLGPAGARKIPIEKFYLSYRKTALKPQELIVGISFEVPSPDDSLRLRKVSQRKDLDISCVNAGFRIEWANREQRKIRKAFVSFGGVAATPLRLSKTEALFQGQTLSPALTEQALETMATEMTPLSDLRGSASYRRVVAENLLRDFCRESSEALPTSPSGERS